jgi:hypothetical protein
MHRVAGRQGVRDLHAHDVAVATSGRDYGEKQGGHDQADKKTKSELRLFHRIAQYS